MTSLPVALILGPYDPSGAAYLRADIVRSAALSCHALSVPTSLLVRDSAKLEHVQLLTDEIIDDQLRCLLEDTLIQAIKSGPVYSPEVASILAEVSADYSEVPLVLHLTSLPEHTLIDPSWPEDTFDAIYKLVLPQTSLLVVDRASLLQWQAEGLLNEDSPATQQLLDAGVDHVLCTAYGWEAGMPTYRLYSHVDHLDYTLNMPAILRQQDLDSLLSTAICAHLAQGLELAAAIERSIEYLQHASQQHFQLGMGQRQLNHITYRHD